MNLIEGRKSIVLLNKTDLEMVLTPEEIKEKTGKEVVAVSAKEQGE